MIALVSLLLSIGLDTLAVAIGLGVAQVPRRFWLRIAATFAVCEGGMPIIGMFVGRRLADAFGQWPAIAAAGLLVLVGALTIREALSDDDAPRAPAIGGWPLLVMGLTVSLDEAAVGFSLGAMHARLGLAIVCIAAQAVVLTCIGLWIGRRVGAAFGERAELIAGIILVLLGLALLVEQVSGVRVLGGVIPS